MRRLNRALVVNYRHFSTSVTFADKWKRNAFMFIEQPQMNFSLRLYDISAADMFAIPSFYTVQQTFARNGFLLWRTFSEIPPLIGSLNQQSDSLAIGC